MRLSGEPFPLTGPFLVGWSGGELGETEAAAGSRWLDRHRFIVRAGHGKPTGRGMPPSLWHVVDPGTSELAGGIADPVRDDDLNPM
jgi:hypothetical protein